MYKHYQNYGVKIEEMRLHKLLYFIQKESYKLYNEPAFEEDMVGWVYGPVSLDVRYYYDDLKVLQCTNLKVEELINNVYDHYGDLSINDLIEETHKEVPWLNSRVGYSTYEIGNVIINKDDIKLSSLNEECFDMVWGMRYEEHEDY